MHSTKDESSDPQDRMLGSVRSPRRVTSRESGVPSQSGAVVSARPAMQEPLTEDALIRVQARAIHAICSRLTARHLEALQRSVEHACLMPKHIGWHHKATAHAEIFGLLADAAHHPVLAQTLNSGAGLVHRLMMTAGPTVGTITANSRKRLLARLSANDPAGAAHEMERHLIVLRFIGRVTSSSSRPSRPAPLGAGLDAVVGTHATMPSSAVSASAGS
jgi:DNA-binding FadR family transcriptional regulator